MSPGAIAQLACVLEVTARKPGNVHRFADFADAGYLDFLLSAQVIVGPLNQARELGIGRTVLECVKATQRLISTNTNLGIILLLAPLACVPEGERLQDGLASVLSATTVDDARNVYEAIRLMRPGGLGSAEKQDIHHDPTVTLVGAMRIASDRDAIARQYVTTFADIFDIAVPALKDSVSAGRSWETAVVFTHLTLLSRLPDTLIARKRGGPEAKIASVLAKDVLESGWPDREEGVTRFRSLDAWLREVGHARNPGATADLVAAALFAALRDGTIVFPLKTEVLDLF